MKKTIHGNQRRAELSYALVASILSIIVTLLSVLISVSFGTHNANYAIPAVYIGLVVSLMALGAIYLAAYRVDLARTQNDIRDAERLSRVVPTLITFRRRSDTLVVERDGNGILTWDFELSSDPSVTVTELNFPFYLEVPSKNAPPRPVIIDSVEVNGEFHEPQGVYEFVERRVPVSHGGTTAAYLVEYGRLRVPVDLGQGREICRVRVRIKLYGVLLTHVPTNYLLVDIPYVTEQLVVTIMSPSSTVRKYLGRGGVALEVSAGLMDTPDPTEIAIQNHQCRQAGPALIWETDSSKLGYRYKLYFQLQAQNEILDRLG